MDLFLLLTPIFVLAIVALLGFVGCNQIFGLGEVHLRIDLTSVIPAFGPSVGGTQVKIVGSNLTDVDKVTFNGIDAASFTVVGDGEIDAVTPAVPAGPAGIVVTKTSGEDAGSSDPLMFTFVAINFMQATAAEQNTSPPIAVTLNNTGAGNLLIAAVSYAGPAAGSVSVSDNLGNAFMLAGNAPWFRQSRILYLPNIPGGNVTITATGAGGASGPCTLCVSEYQGADPTAAAVYGFATNHASNGTAGVEDMQGVTVAPAQMGDLVYVVVFTSRDTQLMAGTGFVGHPLPIGMALLEDNGDAVAMTDTVATTDSTGGNFIPWVILAVAIKA